MNRAIEEYGADSLTSLGSLGASLIRVIAQRDERSPFEMLWDYAIFNEQEMEQWDWPSEAQGTS